MIDANPPGAELHPLYEADQPEDYIGSGPTERVLLYDAFDRPVVTELIPGRKCVMCGCTEERACATPNGPCFWVNDQLCSACASTMNVLPADLF